MQYKTKFSHDASRYMNVPRSILTVASTLLLAACSQAAIDEEGAETDIVDSGEVGSNTEESDPFSGAQMPSMSQTAWRVIGEDGAVYTTFFDASGSYRDFKNGGPVQSGSWIERTDGQLCFTPEDDARIGDCWKLNMVSKEGIMKPVSDAGKTIELRQVTYIAPAEMQAATGN